jgi:hypothetical protein
MRKMDTEKPDIRIHQMAKEEASLCRIERRR